MKLDTGVKTVVEKLDGLFLPDKGRRQFTAFHNLYNLRRTEEKSMSEFVSEFEHTYYKFKNEEMILPDPVMAFMLLASSGLLESDVQLVMSAIEKVSYDNMKNVLKRVFSSGIKTSPSSNSNTMKTEVKVEPVLHTNSEATSSIDSVFITQGNQRYRGKPSYNKGYSNNPRGRGKRGPLTGSNMERI